MPAINLEQVIFNLGSQLGEQLIAGFQAAMSRNAALTVAARPAATAARSSGCSVPGCRNPSKSTGLCGKHYQKARRNKFDGNHLTAEQLEILAADGRALRFAKAGTRVGGRAAAEKGASASRGGPRAVCIVPGCGGVVASNQLCPRHYQKSRRNGFTGKKLTDEQLQFLSQDGRALRFAKSKALIARGSKKASRPLAARRSRKSSRKGA
jgi:hypothetical protein